MENFLEIDITFYNSFFKGLEDFQLLVEFQHGGYEYVKGKIRFTFNDSHLDFDVLIPHIFPLEEEHKKLTIFCKEAIGYNHVNYKGAICLHIPAESNLINKLNLYIEALKQWVNKYYVNQEQDSHYDYLLYGGNYVPGLKVFFNEETGTNNEKRFEKNRFGLFDVNKITSLNFIAMNLGNVKYDWYYISRIRNMNFKGAWAYIEKEPQKAKNIRITNWEELNSILPEGFSDFFVNHCKKTPIKKLPFKDYYFLMLGYLIPNNSQKELHWDLVLIPHNMFTRSQAKKGNIDLTTFSDNILWGYSYNASYNRFFGRGKLSDELTNSSILIIGIGAIGSCLANILIRGGVRNLTIVDKDDIEPGNACRSEYEFVQSGFKKTDVLPIKLMSISPFVNVKVLKDFRLELPKTDPFIRVRSKILDYDYIFDCTADDHVAYMLDQMNLSNIIINFSITDNAKEFICVSGTTGILDSKKKFTKDIGVELNPSFFYPGTGCWEPTFNATYFDINLFLNYAVKEINNRILKNIGLRSFVIKGNEENMIYLPEFIYL